LTCPFVVTSVALSPFHKVAAAAAAAAAAATAAAAAAAAATAAAAAAADTQLLAPLLSPFSSTTSSLAVPKGNLQVCGLHFCSHVCSCHIRNACAVFNLSSARPPPCPPLPPTIVTSLSIGPIMEGSVSATGSKTSDGHPGRVLSLSYLGSAHAPAVISTTSSGYCGVWNVDSLSDPAISCIPLSPSCDYKGAHYPPLSAAASISGSVGNSSSNAGNMSIEAIVGRVDGALLVYNRGGGYNSERVAKGTAAGGQGHSAPITCIATPAIGGSTFRDLAVTTSMDWGLKLWSLKVGCFKS
jgi:hypothetical protein